MGWTEARTTQTRDGAELIVRTVEEDDVAAVLEHARAAIGSGPFDVTEPDEFDHTEESERAWIRSLREQENSLLLGAVAEGRIVGLLNFHGGKRRKVAHTGHFGIGVQPGWQGRGVGSALLSALIDWAQAHPTVEEITLGVVSENEGAIRLYRRQGFREIGRHPGRFRAGPGRYWTDVHMSLWVKGGPAGRLSA